MSLFWAQLRERRHSLQFALGVEKPWESRQEPELPLLLGGPLPQLDQHDNGLVRTAATEAAGALAMRMLRPTFATQLVNRMINEKDSATVQMVLGKLPRGVSSDASSPANVEQWGAAVVATVLLRDAGETSAVSPCVDGCVRWRSLASDVTGMIIGALVHIALKRC